MRSEIRTALAVLATAAVLMGSATMALGADADADPSATATATATTPTASTPEPTATAPTPTPTPSPSESTSGPAQPETTRTIDDAQLRWGINDESNNRAFAPGTFNFLSAGNVPDPGRGGVVLPQSAWSQRSGDVSIEKYLNGSWTPATWAGLRTTSSGTTMAGTNGPFSNHEVVVSGGTGTVDPTTGSASIQWTGSFTVVYYSGYSFFYVTDPRLVVSGGIGRLTGTLSGFRSSMDDLGAWEAVTPVADVVLADLGAVDLSKQLGFSTTPAYKGVAVTLASDQVPQVRTGATWGSFPQSFVDFQTASGTGAYWYSSGGSADAHKAARPVTVSYAAGAPLTVAPPSSKKGTTAKIKNDAPKAPGDPSRTAPAGVVPPAAVPAAPAAPVTAEALQAAAISTQLRPASTVTGVQPRTATTGASRLWILGGVLLAGAVLISASPSVYAATRRGRP